LVEQCPDDVGEPGGLHLRDARGDADVARLRLDRRIEMRLEQDDHLAGVQGEHPLGHLGPGDAGHPVVEQDDRGDRWRIELVEPLQRSGPSAASCTTLKPPRSRKTRASIPISGSSSTTKTLGV
jgi:hypothetical protein